MVKDNKIDGELRVLIAGGGTGGHLFPAMAVAEEISHRVPNAKITFVGTAKGLESRVIPHTMWDLVTMQVPQMKGSGIIRKIFSLLSLPYAFAQSIIIIARVKPAIVISVGGYAAGPITLTAAMIGKKTVALEQNAIPGITNRILGKFVKKIFVTFAESLKYFSSKKAVVLGNPVRRKIRDAATHKQMKNQKFSILIFGGSQGAKSINERTLDALDYLQDLKDDIHIIHQIGRLEDTERFSAAYKAKGFSVEVYHFIEDMAKAYQRTDMVICRSGATSIAELSVMGRPAIFVPYPYSADDHQVANANALVSVGAAIVILNKDLTGELLATEIKGLIEEPLRLASMADAMKRFGKPLAAHDIVEECLTLINYV